MLNILVRGRHKKINRDISKSRVSASNLYSLFHRTTANRIMKIELCKKKTPNGIRTKNNNHVIDHTDMD